MLVCGGGSCDYEYDGGGESPADEAGAESLAAAVTLAAENLAAAANPASVTLGRTLPHLRTSQLRVLRPLTPCCRKEAEILQEIVAALRFCSRGAAVGQR